MAHGVNVNEQPTGVRPPVSSDAGLPVYFGTAPINSVDLTNVNKPKLVSTLAEAVAACGALSDDFESWTLHEAIKSHFSVYNVGPIVLVNVLDPENPDHVSSASGESHQLVNGSVKLQVYASPDAPMLGILKSTVVVTGSVLGTDYTLAFDDDGFLVVTVVDGGNLADDDVILVDFDYLDPSGVTADDIIGGYSGGEYTGLEVIEQVYPALRKVPGFIVAPGFSDDETVAAAMQVKAALINGSFQAMALLDLPTDGTIATYADAPAWKSDNGYTSKHAQALWPKLKNGDDVYHASTVYACVHNATDAANKLIPYVSASNQQAIGTASVLDDGTEVLLTKPQANALNAQGINTFLNGFFGWRTWGNRTACFPGNTDVKDNFAPIRRMFNWMSNTIILTTDAYVDDPANRRLVDSVNGTLGAWINGLIAQEALVDGKIEFRSDENPVTDLSNGIVRWHVTATPPSPGEQLEFTLEYDPNGLAALFAS